MNIHDTALIGKNVELGPGVSVGAYTVIEGNTYVGGNSKIDSHCHLGYSNRPDDDSRLTIGSNANIRSHSVFYAGSTFGDGLVTGHRVTVREATMAKNGLQIGTLSDIQGHCTIGDYTKLHSNVHIGHLSYIEDYVWIFPYVVLTNDPHPPSEYQIGCTVKRFAAIATMSVILPGISIGEGALVGAQTLVRENVPNDMICVGNPGKVIGSTSKIKFRDSDRLVYPWRRHFHRGYPDEVVAAWQREFPES